MSVSTTLATTITLKVTAQLTRTETEGTETITTAPAALSLSYSKSLASGTDVDQADKIHRKRYALSTSPTPIDLAGALTDPLGQVVTFVEVIGIVIVNLSTTVGQVVNVGGNAAPFATWLGAGTDVIKIGPGGEFSLINPAAAGYTVTGGTADILDLTAAAGTPSVEVLIIGRSA